MATDSCTHKLENDKICKTSSTNTQDIKLGSLQLIPEHICIQRKVNISQKFSSCSYSRVMRVQKYQAYLIIEENRSEQN